MAGLLPCCFLVRFLLLFPMQAQRVHLRSHTGMVSVPEAPERGGMICAWHGEKEWVVRDGVSGGLTIT